jgi:SecD/SecF fusion protein
MQNKGAISFFAILFALVCLFELSFTFVVSNIEKDAKAFSAGDPSKERAYLDSISTEPVYNIVLKKYTYQECKERELNLGLDLKGGMNVTLEVSVQDVVRSLARNSQDPVFKKSLQDASAQMKSSGGNYLNLFAEAVKKNDPNARLSSPAFFGNQDMAEVINSRMTNEEVLEQVRIKVKSSIDNAYNVIRNRIDKFGVVQPNIQRLEGTDRILVELPGVKDPERVRKLLQGAAKLEFWETYESGEVFADIQKANDKLKDINSTGKTDTTAAVNLDSSAVAVKDSSAKDSTKLSLTEKLAQKADSAAKDTTAKGQMSDAEARKQFPLLSMLRPYTDAQGRLAPGPRVGYSLVSDTGKVNQILNRADIKNVMQRKDVRFLWTAKAVEGNKNIFDLIAVKVPRDGNPRLTGDHVTNAVVEYGQLNNKPEVSMAMDGPGANIWRRMTKENVKKSIAIVLDDYVYSFPTVQNEIAGGRSSISGNFSPEEAKDLANILNSGKMDAPARIVQEAVVGPSLGKEAINAGLISSLVGLLLVFLFMAFYYSGAGLVADIALLTNVFFLIGVMASLQAVLTLPGIAGIVLTIGMSVDANVLIYERIREELAAGKGYKLAIADGFKNAYSAIIDSNVTTLLTGIILLIFGSGPIKGFATTLVIGILTSLFSAIFITRIVFELFSKRNKQLKFSIPLTANILKGSNFDFISQRKRFYIVSLIIIGAGLVSMFTKGFGYGVDFEGGRSYVLRFEKPVNTQQIRDVLYKSFKQSPDVKVYGSSNQVQVTTDYLVDDNSPKTDSLVESMVLSEMTKMSGKTPEVVLQHKVEPTVAGDIKESAVWSVIFSLLVLFLYLLLRFRKWQYGVGAIAALAYVVLFILSIFSIFRNILPFSLDIDQSFIAAILTVVGYAINDTVVIFDRIREYLGMHSSKKEEMGVVINNALNSTLSRTVVTGLSTIGVLIILFIFGGEVIRGFSFAMLIGVIVGTYTSLFVASPVVVDLSRRVAGDLTGKK